MDAVAESSGNKQLACLRCGTPMVFLKREDIQLGKASFWAGDMEHVLAGSLPVTMYVCPDCGHLELFTHQRPDGGVSETDGALPGIPYYIPGTGNRCFVMTLPMHTRVACADLVITLSASSRLRLRDSR